MARGDFRKISPPQAVSVPEECPRIPLCGARFSGLLGSSSSRLSASRAGEKPGDVQPVSSPLRNAPPPIAPELDACAIMARRAGDGWGAVEEQSFARYFDMRRFARLLASDEERGAILFTRIRSRPLLWPTRRCCGRHAGHRGAEVAGRGADRGRSGASVPRNSCPGSTSWGSSRHHDRRGGGMAARDLLEITSKDPAVSAPPQPSSSTRDSTPSLHSASRTSSGSPAASRTAATPWRCRTTARGLRRGRAVNERTPPVYLSCTSFISLLLLC